MLDYTISFDDYDIEFGSENFEDPNSTFDTAGSSTNTFERATTASIIPSIFIPNAFKSNAASTKPSSHPASAENVSNRALDNSSKHVITVKTTIKNIWKTNYLQPLYDLVHTTNSLVTHTFSFSKHIFLQELATNGNFALNEFVTKDFFVQVFFF